MRIGWIGLGCLSVVACGSDDDESQTDDPQSAVDETTDPPDDAGPTIPTDPATCAYEVDFTVPVEGDSAVYHRAPVEFWLDVAAAGSEVVAVQDAGGSDIAGVTSAEGLRVWFTADVPLASEVTYTATLSAPGCDDSQVTFTTSATGAVVDDMALVGRAYSFKLTDARWLHPEGFGALLAALPFEMIFGVLDSTGDTLQMELGISYSDSPDQNLCLETVPFPDLVDFSSNPFFSAGPIDVDTQFEDFGVVIDSFVVTGSMASDASQVDGMTLQGVIDLRPTVAALTIAETPDELCEIFAIANIFCEPCTDTEPYCLTLEADSITGVADDPLIVRTEVDIALDPSCQ